MRWFLIDQVTELVPGQRARGVKCVTLADPVLHDHFPDYPVLPGMLILEGAAQLAGFLIEMSANRPDAPLRRAVLAQVRDARFHQAAGPGDRLELEVTLGSSLEAAAQVVAEVRAGDRRIARAELVFYLKEIASERVHEQRRYLYRLWTRELSLDRPIL